jgi:hypothetical protein
MSVRIVVQTKDKDANERQRAIAQRVLDEYADSLPDFDLLVFLDDQIWYELRNHGSENRGAFFPIGEEHYPNWDWPQYLRGELADVDPLTLALSTRVDALIYLHSDTCEDEASLTTTLAHELQHFIQYGSDCAMWAWSFVLFKCNGLIDAEKLSWRHIPTEQEARIIAKRVSQRVLGDERTDQYIELRRTKATKPRDAEDWQFIQTIDTSQPYDVAHETRAIFAQYGKVPTYRKEMDEVLTKARKMSEFKQLNLDDIIGA